MGKEDLTIKRLLLNDLFLDYVCTHAETLSDLYQHEAISSLASKEDIQAAVDIIMSQNRDVAMLTSEESDELKKSILDSILSLGTTATFSR